MNVSLGSALDLLTQVTISIQGKRIHVNPHGPPSSQRMEQGCHPSGGHVPTRGLGRYSPKRSASQTTLPAVADHLLEGSEEPG